MNGLFSSPLRNLRAGLIFMGVVAALAVTGYRLAGWSFGDALYMVIITIFTVGYEEVRPINTPALRALTELMIVLGCTGVIYLTGVLVQFITFNQLEQILGTQRMRAQVGRLSGHVVICGFGRIGAMLAQELRAGRSRFVIVERDEVRLAAARSRGYVCVSGDATDEAVLKAAGIERAHTVATVLPDDAANVFITLSARSLNPALEIIARGEAPSTEGKLLHAGANHVVLPAHIGAERIAQLILYPEAHGSAARRPEEDRDLRDLGLQEELLIAGEGGPIAGRTVAEVEQLAPGSFLAVVLKRQGGEVVASPGPDIRIEPGDGLVILCREEQAGTIMAALGTTPGMEAEAAESDT